MNGFRLSVVLFSVMAIPTMVGCTRVEATPGQHTGAAGESQGTAPAADMAPRMVIPATGGAPILGIPVGGGLYIPVTGGAPIPGTPVTP